MCKSEYKLTRKMQWYGDVLKVQDTIHDVLREAKQAAEDAMTGEVLSHFECDFSDFREYMHDKIKWEQKQHAAIPKWIPVTERLPENDSGVLAFYDDGIESRIIPATFHPKSGWYDCLFNMPSENISYWMPLPEPPKEEEHE